MWELVSGTGSRRTNRALNYGGGWNRDPSVFRARDAGGFPLDNMGFRAARSVGTEPGRQDSYGAR
ncbi:MAG: hypothetical protein KIT58_00220 [Planctomycetota bacterium]|nr:hypothetical protein [Planctomycetota bacterium]